MAILRVILCAFIFCLSCAPTVHAEPAEVAVIFMHGKWVGPLIPPYRGLLTALQGRGYKVESLMMPWSKLRMYDKDYGEALQQIDSTVEKLKASGAKRILIGGHSFGGNAALAYASTREGVAGIYLLVPAHWVDHLAPEFVPSMRTAKQMIAEGKGEEISTFHDNNQGVTKEITTSARIYASYFDPEGLGAMSITAPRVNPGTATLAIVGTRDRGITSVKPVIYNRVPPHPKSRYLEVEADHIGTVAAGTAAVLDWAKQFE